MASKLVKLKLHGDTWDSIPSDWEFKAKSLGEALRFLEMNTKRFYRTLLDNDKKNIRYEIILNGRKFKSDKKLTLENLQDIKDSELMMKIDDLETIDIVPVLEGADSDIFQSILGVVLIIVGFIITGMSFGLAGPIGGAMIVAGLGLLASGVIGLLTKAPKFEDFREIEQGGKTSYLFAGPQNIIGEGGPVPVGYGRLIIGSQVVSAAYVIRDYSTTNTSVYLRDEYGNLQPLLK